MAFSRRVLLAGATGFLCPAAGGSPARAEGAQPKLLRTFGHTVAVNGLAVSPDGSVLAALSLGTVRVWDVKERAERFTVKWAGGGFPRTTPLAFSPDGKLLVQGAEVYDLTSYERKVRLDFASEPTTELGGVGSVAVSPNGKTLATAGGHLYHLQLKLWDLGSGKWKKTLIPWSPGTSFVNSAVFSPDGARIAADADGEVRVWEVESGKLVQTLKGPGGITLDQVAFSPDGGAIAAAGYEVDASRNPSRLVTRFWDAASARELLTIPLGPYRDRKTSVSLSYAPGGKLIAISDGRVRFFHAADGSPAGELPAEVQSTRVCFLPPAPDEPDHRIAVGQMNGLVSLWSTP